MVSLFLLCSHYLVGQQIETDDVVIGLEEVIGVPRQEDSRRFGATGALPILFREAWPDEIQLFEAEGDKLPFDVITQ